MCDRRKLINTPTLENRPFCMTGNDIRYRYMIPLPWEPLYYIIAWRERGGVRQKKTYINAPTLQNRLYALVILTGVYAINFDR